MRIQHNIMAMSSYRNFMTNNNGLTKNLEKLSSGYRINRAGDDAAGLAISEKMRAQITGLDAAQKNVKDGISLVKTAEGAMQEIQDMLNRMSYLATQSANGTYQNEVDRENLQKEVDALRTEINRIAESTNFNGQTLLDGKLSLTTSKQNGSAAGTHAIVPEFSTGTNGTERSEGKKAEITFSLADSTASVSFDSAITDGMAVSALGNITLDGVSISSQFDLVIDGVSVAWSSTSTISALGTTAASGVDIKLVAKMDGAMSTDQTDVLDAGSIDYTNGKAEGDGASARKAKYELEFDFTKLADGQTFTIGSHTFEISTDGVANTSGATVITVGTFDVDDAVTGQDDIANAINDAVSAALTGDFKAGVVKVSGDKVKLTFTAVTAGATSVANLGAVQIGQHNEALKATYTTGVEAGGSAAGNVASATLNGFDLSKLAEGDKITIGGKTVEIVKSGEETNDGTKITLADAQDGAKLAQAFADAGLTDVTLSFANNQLTATNTKVSGQTAQEFAESLNITFNSNTKLDEAVEDKYSSAGGLKLQIGDTADPHNQLTVVIGDMHVTSMGIMKEDGAGVDRVDGKSINEIMISDQASAAEAVNIIKGAINYVSSVRGDLGAVQNRLEHTANNLSVMEENIQDAEATIRDTDMADEMTAYTKNNILMQAAQAMLAQANQVPQGVLQLLQ